MIRLLVASFLLLLLLAAWQTVTRSEPADHDTQRVKTDQQWGSEKPWYVIEEPTTTTAPAARARTAPTEPTMRAAAVEGHDEAIAAIRQAFTRFGEAVVQQAINVSGCETGHTYDPTVVNSSGHTGLFQLSPRYHTERAQRLGFTWDRMREALPNAIVAADIFAESRWGPWTCRYAA